MLEAISLGNFRAFKDLNLRFSKLNVFVGPNNSGKSSVISAINLIAQNVRRERLSTGLSLNGPYADLGTYYDAVHDHKANSNMKLEFVIDSIRYEYTLRYRLQRREIELLKGIIEHRGVKYSYQQTKDGASHSLQSRRPNRNIPLGRLRPRVFGLNFHVPFAPLMTEGITAAERETANQLRHLLQRASSRLHRQFRNFDAIGAFRAPPSRTYGYSGESPTDIGRAGENLAEIIASSSSNRERDARTLMSRTSQWFRDAGVANGIEIRPLTNRHFELTVEDRIGFSNNIVDVGFGCSQALPVIIGGYKVLGSSRNDADSMYVVQEPEIHLHPNAAAHMGTFFCQLATRGTQCFCRDS